MLTEKLDELKNKVVKYAHFVRGMISNSIKALNEKNKNIAQAVINEDEPHANDIEVELDEICINIIALYSPEAKNLRQVVMLSKMAGDLERMADKAVKIAESAFFLADKADVQRSAIFSRLCDEMLSMVDDSIKAFINEDSSLAYATLKKDDLIDDLRDQILRELLSNMNAGNGAIENSLYMQKVARKLEKIGDLTSHLCEEVIYIKEGKVVRHQKTY